MNGTFKCDHIKRLITLVSDYNKRLFLRNHCSKVRPCKTGKFPLKFIETITEILTIITKRLIAIIIVSFIYR